VHPAPAESAAPRPAAPSRSVSAPPASSVTPVPAPARARRTARPTAAPAPVVDRPAAPERPVPTSILGRALATAVLVHPFPSILDGLVVAVVATVAGAVPARALVLGVSMALLQFAIGALNDIVDAPVDRAAGRRKPIPDGLVRPTAARAVAMTAAGGGLLLGLLGGGPMLVLLALVVLAIGGWYDLLAKGTRISWLPLAVGVPLLPVYGWLGAAGALPPAFGVLVPIAALAGAALAISNSAVDIERDRASGVTSLAVALGPLAAAIVTLLLQLLVAIIAVGSGSMLGASGTWLTVAVGVALIPVGGAVLGVLVARRGPVAREIAFEVQAVGLALLVVAWVNALGVVA